VNLKMVGNTAGTQSLVRVVTDSVSDVPDDILNELGVTMVPVIVRFGTEEFRDRRDITMDQFMARLTTTKEPARTSQPSPGAFVEAFRQAAEGGAAVVSIQPSAKFSGTYQSACIARDILAPEGYRIEVLNTETGSMGQGWAVIQAARAALAGLPVERVLERARAISQRVHVLLAVDTLTYLQRNGRLGRVPAMVGSILGLKPILAVRHGELGLCEMVRGADKLKARLVKAITRSVPEGAKVALGVVHAAAREKADQLRQELSRVYRVVESVVTETGPAIAANTGPGAFGAMLYEVDG